MLGHSPLKLNRLNNIKNTLNAASNWVELIIKDPKIDTDVSILNTFVKDALSSIKELEKDYYTKELEEG